MDAELQEGLPPRAPTQLLADRSRSVIARNDSPDVGFETSVNPYRGCEHGCTYCYARPFHEYLGFSAGLDFETKILVKPDAPELLRRELMAPSWQPQLVVLSGVTDCYQPAERRLGITRRCLEVLAELRNPAAVITKNRLVTRDAETFSAADCLIVVCWHRKALEMCGAAGVQVSEEECRARGGAVCRYRISWASP